MLVQQPIQTQVGSIQNIPKDLIASLVVGQRVEAVALSASIAAEVVSLKVANSLLEFRSPIGLQAGQKVLLEVVVENGKPVLRLIPPASVGASEPMLIKPGQQVLVDVIKVLAENRLLVQTSPIQVDRTVNKAAQQNFDIDTTQLTQRHKVGDKLLMDVVSVKPLSVQIRPENVSPREQVIGERIRQLVPQQLSSPSLKKLITSFQNQQLPEAVQKTVQQLLQHSIDKTDLTKAHAFKQAAVTSGVVMERQLLTEPTQRTQDFKANVLTVLKAVETVIQDNKGQISDKAINKLPAQVQAALTAQGRTPAQLINVLLSGQRVPTLLSSLNPQTNIPSIISQQQAASLVALLNKPFLPAQQIAARHASMDPIELMQLFKEVEGVHNKIQLNQLNMLKEPESTSTVASWLFDIPIKDKQALDLLQVQIDQHKQASEDDDDIWNVKLRLDTQNLGPIQATVTLHNSDVKVIIRAERQESAHLLDANLALLDEALEKLGVSMSHSSCYCGTVDKAVNLGAELDEVTRSLLDVSV